LGISEKNVTRASRFGRILPLRLESGEIIRIDSASNIFSIEARTIEIHQMFTPSTETTLDEIIEMLID